jgi:S-phase kinase-associated protein 1
MWHFFWDDFSKKLGGLYFFVGRAESKFFFQAGKQKILHGPKHRRKMAALDMEDAQPMLTLTSSDNQEFAVDRKCALISNLIKTSVEADPEATQISILSVKGSILQLVVDYMQHHKGTDPELIPKPLRSKLMKDVCKDPHDAQFIDDIGEDRQQLYDLVLAANYLDVKSLLHLGCAKVASLIKGQPLEKIKDILAQGEKGARVLSKDEEKE